MLKSIEINIEKLLLDPNNTRFIKDLSGHQRVVDEEVESLQKKTLSRFSRIGTSDEIDVTNISDLYASMKTIGYVSIDRIVVKNLLNTDKYLVIEGNRRISAVKTILRDVQKNEGDFDTQKKRDKVAPLLDSFNTITCMFLDTSQMSKEDEAHNISVILGLRHHGSLLSWEPLPRAYNIYKEYMNLEPVSGVFSTDPVKFMHVSSQLSISVNKVKNALRTYLVYIQLSELYSVKDIYYSMIEEGVTNKYLKDSYFEIDDETFKMDEVSLERMNNICQFEKRDSINPEREKKILADPKSFTKLGKIIEKRRNTPHDAIKRYADDLLRRVEDESDMDMTLPQALDDLINMELSVKWIDTVNGLLDRQEEKLQIDEYSGIGNDRAYKDELKKKVQILKSVLNIKE